MFGRIDDSAFVFPSLTDSDPRDGKAQRLLAEQMLVEAASGLISIGEARKAAAEECFQECRSHFNQCRDCIRGAIERYKETAEKLYIKTAEKVRHKIAELRDDAVYYGRKVAGSGLVESGIFGTGPEASLSPQLDIGQAIGDPAKAGELYRTQAAAIELAIESGAVQTHGEEVAKELDIVCHLNPRDRRCPSPFTLDDTIPTPIVNPPGPPPIGPTPTVPINPPGGGPGTITIDSGGTTGGTGGTGGSGSCTITCPPGYTPWSIYDDATGKIIPACKHMVFGTIKVADCVEPPDTKAPASLCATQDLPWGGPQCPPLDGLDPGVEPIEEPTDSDGDGVPDDAICTIESFAFMTTTGDDPVVMKSPGKLSYMPDGSVYFKAATGLVYSGLVAEVGQPLALSGASWGGASQVGDDGSLQWLYQNSTLGSQIVSDAKLELTNLQIGLPGDKAQCKAPPPPPPVPASSKGFDVCNPDHAELAELIERYANLAGTLTPGGIANLVKLQGAVYGDTTGGILGTVWKAIKMALLAVFSMPIYIVAGIANWLTDIVPTPPACDNSAKSRLSYVSGIANMFGRWFGLVPDSMFETIKRLENYVCQWRTPTTDALNAAYMRGRATKKQWEFGVKMNADCLPWQQMIVDAGRPTPPLPQIWGMYNAELITGDEFQALARRAGIDPDDDLPRWNLVVEQIPAASDLMRFMVRDVEDMEVVESQQLDKDFDKKWTGKIKEWGQRQNISDDIARKHYRAHWQQPSPTMMYEGLHRLAPDMKAETPDKRPVSVTVDDVRQGLQINDLAPVWIDRAIALSYREIGRVDIRRGYEVGTFKEDELSMLFRKLGYSEETSKHMKSYTIAASGPARAKFNGYLSRAELNKFFDDDFVDEEYYRGGLALLGLSSEAIDNAVAAATGRKLMADRKVKLGAAKKSFIKGKLNREEYAQVLRSLNIQEVRITEILDRDSWLITQSSKELTLGTLCEMVGRGYMTSAEYVRRAQNLGWKENDALALLINCQVKQQEKRDRENEAAFRKAQADADKADRKRKADLKEKRAEYMANLPCKPKPKPYCPPGVRVNGTTT